jgi:predicted TIM-barrel fold metal-dependent hydrolase
MRLVDTHVHFWDQGRDDLRYEWLQPGVAHPILGNIEPIKSPLFDPSAFIAETRFCGVCKAVHVEADARSARPMAEPDWVRSVARASGLPTAIVVHVDLGAPSGPDEVAVLRQWRDIRGVRDFGTANYLRDPASHVGFEASLHALEEAGLVLDLDCVWEDMGAARKLAEAHPLLRIVLEHIGYPRRRDDAYFASWSPAIRNLALAGNVHCKLSGLGMTERSWTTGSLRRWVTTSLEAFGPARCMFGSNWPVDRIASSYDALINAFLELIGTCTSEEKEAVCSANAEALYFS